MSYHEDYVRYVTVPKHYHSANQFEAEDIEKVGDIDFDPFDTTETGGRSFLYFAATIANLTAFVSGVSVGWSSPVIPKLSGDIEPENNPLPEPLTPNQQSWLGSLLPLGAVFGPVIAGLIVDRIGRKKSLLISTLPFIAAFIIAIFSHNVNLYYVMRVLCGLGLGAVFTVLPMYVGEIAEDSNRGALGSFLALFMCMGILFSYCVGPFVPLTTFNIICVVPPIVFFPIFLVYIPDSSHSLIARNDEAGAEKALTKFRQKSSRAVHNELLEIRDSVQESLASKGRIIDLFRSKGLIRALMISLGLVSFQQLSGINIIFFYAQTIFSLAGSSVPAEISTIIVGCVQVLAGFLTPMVVERTGKRAILIFSAIGMGISMALLGFYFYVQHNATITTYFFWLPILSLICFNITYSVGFGPLPWAVLGEVFPPNMKSVASTITAAFCWFLAFIITNIFGTVTAAVGIYGSFWLFSCFCVIAFLFVYMLVPETSRKTLQEIRKILDGAYFV
ncbi:hypothetical protein PPYR_11128 [Photinus pyralis]|uniref:Major facilitator superfamily (MFS) profile domain-containing protein n=1 Tax=Photinus pyralis TaxID=7054 RepID=A0A5N4AAI8_PHOPY|nr:facilitated trehalose transporter Tret1-like [Photinus pyralis]KAB0794289.1 hypothetical protein PPYR_11128 [Photinus pyralis]